MEPRDRFAINLRKARQRAQISQEELGFCAGIRWNARTGRFSFR